MMRPSVRMPLSRPRSGFAAKIAIGFELSIEKGRKGLPYLLPAFVGVARAASLGLMGTKTRPRTL